MVLVWVDGVYTNGVGGELLEIWDVALAGVGVGQRIAVCLIACGRAIARVVLLVSDTLHEAAPECQYRYLNAGGVPLSPSPSLLLQLSAVVLVEELGALDDDRREIGGSGAAYQRRGGGGQCECPHDVGE